MGESPPQLPLVMGGLAVPPADDLLYDREHRLHHLPDLLLHRLGCVAQRRPARLQFDPVDIEEALSIGLPFQSVS
jgi:hypothetical protein